MDAEEPSSVLKIRPPYEVTREEDSNERPDSLRVGYDSYDQDRDLRSPCFLRTPHLACIVSYFSPSVCLDAAASEDAPGSDVGLKANKRLRTGFGILMEVLCVLLSSVLTVVHQRLLEETHGSWTREGRRGKDGSCPLASDGPNRGKRNDFTHDALRLLHESKKMRMVCHPRNDTSKKERHYSDPKNSRGQMCYFNGKGSAKKLWRLVELFGYFQPAFLSGAVYPVKGQRSGGDGDSRDVPDPEVTPSAKPPSSSDNQWPPDTVHGLPWVTFRQEFYRVGTFLNLPVNFPVFALSLAQAGFLRLANSAIVCYFCGLRRDEWSRGDSPLDVHRRLRPDCPIVTGVNCNNVTVHEQLPQMMQNLSLSQTEFPGSGHLDDLSAQRQRPRTNLGNGLQTMDIYEDGSDSVSEAQSQTSASAVLAQAAGQSRVSSNQNVSRETSPAGRQPPVRLDLMGGAPSNASPEPATENRAPIHDGTGQPQPPRRNENRQSVTYRQLGIITEKPKRSDMVLVHTRLGTFRNWPSGRLPSALEMSVAGFYYAGYADCGRCFFCSGGLKSWEPADDPWVEHARWFPACGYIKQCQGQDFIDVVGQLNAERSRRQITMREVQEEVRRRRAGGDHIQEMTVDPAVSSAVEIGFCQTRAQAAAQALRSEGHQLTVVGLIERLQADGSAPPAVQSDMADFNPVSAQAETDTLQTENREFRQRETCKICMDNEVAIVFLPCGHLATCATCSPSVPHCPVCRLSIRGRVRIFRA